MSLRVGIIGLPNVGKSTLFNALLKKRVALSANYPFATVEPNIGIVGVPDKRLAELAELVALEEGMIPREYLDGSRIKSGMTGEERKKYLPPIVPAVVEFVDIAGLVKGAHKGEGLGNQFLSHIREVDAIVHVVRDFGDPSAGSGQVQIIREGSVNPVEDKLTIETELGLADLEVVEKLVDNQEKLVKSSKDPVEIRKLEILKVLRENLDQGKILGNYEIGDSNLNAWFRSLPLLSTKPTLYVYNVAEGEYGSRIKSGMTGEGVIICAKLEEELVDLSEDERMAYLQELGIEETGLERLISQAYSLLDLVSFLTAGKKEVRAWTLRRGETALRASGVIHTDFMKGFIRAQVIGYQKLIEVGSMARAKQLGQLRMEGKEYIVQDGDVVEFFISS